MNYRTILFSSALVAFGISVIVVTVFYSATNGFTEPPIFYTSATSIYTVGFQQGLQAVLVVGTSSSTITSQSLSPGMTLFFTEVSVGYIPFQNSGLNLLYVFGIILCGLALVVPLHSRSKKQVGKVKFCINCGAELLPEASFCNKCGAAVS